MTEGQKPRDDNVIVELAVLHARIEGHEVSCARYQRVMMWIMGGAGAVLLMIAIQVAVISGSQSVTLTRLDAQSARMIEVERETVEARKDLEAHLRQLSPPIVVPHHE